MVGLASVHREVVFRKQLKVVLWRVLLLSQNSVENSEKTLSQKFAYQVSSNLSLKCWISVYICFQVEVCNFVCAFPVDGVDKLLLVRDFVRTQKGSRGASVHSTIYNLESSLQ